MRWPSSLFLLWCSFTASVSLAAEDKPCTIHADGKYYDLNPLKASKDYEFKSSGGHKVVLNVCRSVAHETWGLETESPSEVAAFIRKDHGDFSMGKINTTLGMKDSNLQLLYSGGSACKSTDGLRGSTSIEFICDTSVFSAGTPRLVGQFPQDDESACGFFIEWRTHVACPTGERGAWSFFSVIIMFAIVLVMLYLVVGTLHNRYVLQLQGFDQVPQFSFASMKYHLHHAVDWLRESMATGSFHMPANQALNPVSHQSSVPGMPNPQLQRPNPRGGRAADINPVSHQTQVGLAAASPAKPQSPPRQHQQPLRKKQFDLESGGGGGGGGGSQEEREHMMQGGDGYTEQELVDVPKPPEKASQSTAPADADAESDDVAEVRGRGMDSNGVIIRL